MLAKYNVFIIQALEGFQEVEQSLKYYTDFFFGEAWLLAEEKFIWCTFEAFRTYLYS